MKPLVPKARTVTHLEEISRVRHLQQADQLDALHHTSAQETSDIDAIFVLNLEQAHAWTMKTLPWARHGEMADGAGLCLTNSGHYRGHDTKSAAVTA